MDMNVIAAAFVVVVVGGMGNIIGAYLAAVIIGELSAFGILMIPQSTLVMMFLVMAVVLVIRPHGLFGKPEDRDAASGDVTPALLQPASKQIRILGLILLTAIALLPLYAGTFQLILMTEIAIFALASMSLYFIMGPGGMLSFGHAAFFGGGAYAAALMVHHLQTPMELALVMAPLLIGLLALIIGWFCVRLSGVYLAMLTLAFAQICWSIVFQWGGFTGGDDGILSIWPSQWADNKIVFYYLTMVICIGGILALRYLIFTPFGYSMRACRDSALRAGAIGIHLYKYQWAAFAVAGGFAGLAGGIYVFSKGSVFPDEMAIARSFDFLLMVLLGGVDTIFGPVIGSGAFIWLHDTIARIEFWQLILGLVFIFLVVAFPQGIVGYFNNRWGRYFDDNHHQSGAIG
jgi:branched-chain amino acid transport system permease protein